VTRVNHAKDIVNNNTQTFSPDFLDEMKSVGFIGSNNEITDIGSVFIQDALVDYIIRSSRLQ
jgi:hypothetical protein